ncbi:MAG TPA: alpha/beta hydrolase [Trueperaceae bacterium]|nr:alpha/beta hydrolase [Trueperaceae bacterium]
MTEPVSFLDRPLNIERHDADLYVEQVGPVEAPVVYYLHGGPGYNSFSFRDLVGDELGAFQMVYADQRGGGRSYSERDFAVDLLADDVRAVLDALAVSRASLLAHGFGAQVAVRAALATPERFERLVMVNPWLSMPMLARELQRRAAHEAGRPDEALPPESALAEPDALDPEPLVDQAFSWASAKALFDLMEFPDPSSRMRLEHSDATALFGPHHATEPEGVWRLDTLPQLASLRLPTVLLVGTHDATVYPAQAEAGLERMPGALVSLLDAGHYPWIDDPETFVPLLTDAFDVRTS